MFRATVTKNQIVVTQKEPITSGSVNAYLLRFQFSEEWNDLSRVAVFKTSRTTSEILLDNTNECFIPWEVMTIPGVSINFGVYGHYEDKIVIPTIWTRTDTILEGVDSSESWAAPPTPDLFKQLVGRVERLEELISSGSGNSDVEETKVGGWFVRKWPNGYVDMTYNGYSELPSGYSFIAVGQMYRTDDSFFPSIPFPFTLSEKYSESFAIESISPSNCTIIPYSLITYVDPLAASNRHGGMRPSAITLTQTIRFNYSIKVTGIVTE